MEKGQSSLLLRICVARSAIMMLLHMAPDLADNASQIEQLAHEAVDETR